MNVNIKINSLVKLMTHLCLLTILFQNCKMKDEQNKSTATSSSQPQIVLSNLTNYINTNSLALPFEIKGISATNLVSVTCQLNTNAPKNCTNKIAQFDVSVDGTYTLKIVVQIKTGKKIEITKIIIKDSVAPSISVSSQPSAITNQLSGSFNFAVNDALAGVSKVECSLDNASFQVCAGPVTLANLAVGNHNYKIKATDKAGNISAIYSYAWNIDVSAPTIGFTQTPRASSNLINSTFGFSGTNMASYECQLDTAGYSACTSPVTINNLSVGNHAFRVKGINTAGTAAAPVLYSWQVDNVAPTKPTITSNVDANNNQTAAQFSFTSTDTVSGIAKYQCALDSDTFLDCVSPKSLDYVGQGGHIFKVKGLDTAGNISEVATFSWTIDNTAPTAPAITTSVLAATKLNTAQFSFTSSDIGSGLDHFECALDLSAFSVCTSPIDYTTLAPGSHQFKVKAFDKIGNVSTVSTFSWAIDLIGPTISFTQTPSKVFIGSQSNFRFQVTDPAGVASVKCNWISPVEASAQVDCISGMVGYSLPPEGYVLKVEATDRAGNVSVKNYGWDVDDGVGSILKFKSISASGAQVCGLTLDYKVKCWGFGIDQNAFTFTSIAVEKMNLVGVKSLAIEMYQKCALLNNKTVSCWGGNSGLAEGDVGLVDVKTLSSGAGYTCALLESGIVKCWGANYAGTLGDGTTSNSLSPITVSGVSNAKELFTGYEEACVILVNNSVKCWGRNVLTAQERPELNNFKFITLSLNQNCGINAQDELKCWMGSSGLSSIQGLSKVKFVTSTEAHTCAISDLNKVYCFGWGRGELGNLDESSGFAEVLGLDQAKTLTTGHHFTCAITAEDNVKCWGENAQGQLGFSQSALSITTKDIPGLSDIKSISHGPTTTCSLTNSGTVKCWGREALGNGTMEGSEVPVLVDGLNNVKTISASANYVCVQHNDDTVSCWGRGFNSWDTTVPTKISGLTGVKSIEASFGSACAVMYNGTVKCWGSNGLNNLGVESVENTLTAIDIPTFTDIVKVASGVYNTCAINSVGEVKCWGSYLTRTPTAYNQLTNYRFRDLKGGDQSNFCGITFSNEEVCFNVSGPTSINIVNHGNLVANPTQFSNSSLYDTCWLSGPSSVLCNGDNTYGKLGQNWTFPIVSNNSFAQLTTPKPLSSVVTEYCKNYFIYNDGTAGFIGRKATNLHGASAIIKDPR